ncbi:HIR complex subunit [Allomyces javanicus]|nr:HIR complex subunit [Allomyces javanicus]
MPGKNAAVQLLTPNFIKHGTGAGSGETAQLVARVPIFSVDIHPKLDRIVTGGNDNFVRLWSLGAVCDSGAPHEQVQPKELFAGKRHDGAVMCVRWASATGSLLASAADDGAIIIWQYEAKPSQVSAFMSGGAGKTTYPETLHLVRKLPNMESDVIDLAWSHDNRFLASCSLDNTIAIWNGLTFDRITRCSHDSFVKGVAFDPAGQYLVSQSDDGSAILWSTKSWEPVHRITHAFVRGAGAAAVLMRRPAWSPDGQFLVCVNAVSQGVHVAAALPRGKWRDEVRTMHLVGHDLPVCVARFSPVMVYDKHAADAMDDDSDPQAYSVLALGSNDGRVSVWVLQRFPVLVVTTLFDSEVTDLAWSHDGRVLLASAREGRVAGVRFPDHRWFVPDRVPAYGLLNDHQLLAKLRKNGLDPNAAHAVDHANVALAQPARAVPVAPHLRTPQRVSTTRDGRKRIQPTLIATLVAAASAAPSAATAPPPLSPTRPTFGTTAPAAPRHVPPASPTPPVRSLAAARPRALLRPATGRQELATGSWTARVDGTHPPVLTVLADAATRLVDGLCLDAPVSAIAGVAGGTLLAVVTTVGTLLVVDPWRKQTAVNASLTHLCPALGAGETWSVGLAWDAARAGVVVKCGVTRRKYVWDSALKGFMVAGA